MQMAICARRATVPFVMAREVTDFGPAVKGARVLQKVPAKSITSLTISATTAIRKTLRRNFEP